MDFWEYVMMFGAIAILAVVLAMLIDPRGKYNRHKRNKTTFSDPKKRIGLPWMGGDYD